MVMSFHVCFPDVEPYRNLNLVVSDSENSISASVFLLWAANSCKQTSSRSTNEIASLPLGDCHGKTETLG